MNENDQHFVCLIARSKDGRFHVFNGETIDVDDLVGAAKAINETMEGFKNKTNG